MDNNTKIKAIKEFRKKNERSFFEKQGVVGVGTGFKEKGGLSTDQLSLRVYVAKKIAPNNLAASDAVPSSISTQGMDIPTDVIEIGQVLAHVFTERARPVSNGLSIGHVAVTAGTKGAMAVDKTNGQQVFLSNNHILANNNAGKPGDKILQPAVYDGGTEPNDIIATLTRFQPIDFVNPVNVVDCAIATPINQVDASDTFMSPQIGVTDPVVGLLFAGSPTHTIINPIAEVLAALNISLNHSVAAAALKMNVHKCGRTTEYTAASVNDIDATIQVTYDVGVATFVHQIIAGTMSKGGDSGALVLNGGPGGKSGGRADLSEVILSNCILDAPSPTPLPPYPLWPPPDDPEAPTPVASISTEAMASEANIQLIRDFRDNRVQPETEGKRLLDLFDGVEDELLSILNGGDLEVQAVLTEHVPTFINAGVSAVSGFNAGGKGEIIDIPGLKHAAAEMMKVFEKKGSKKLRSAIKQVRNEKLWKETPATLSDVLAAL